MPQVLYGRTTRRPGGWISIIALLLILIIGAKIGSSIALEYAWWNEVGQLETWVALFTYEYAPITIATLVAFAVLWLTHHRAMRFAGADRGGNRILRRAILFFLLILAFFIAAGNFESWTIARYAGSRAISSTAGSFQDPVFHLPLKFYLFELPFYSALRGFLLGLAIFSAILFWVEARLWQLRYRFNELREVREIDLSLFRLPGGLESSFLRGVLAIVLLAFACRFFLGRYAMVWHEHGFMVGVDWLDEHVTLPLQWVLIIAALGASVLAWLGRWKAVAFLFLALPLAWLTPKIISALYVKPNEISLESAYIDSHIHATRSAYGIEKHVHEVEYHTTAMESLDVGKHRNLLDNVRLWDWRAFHDTVTQGQALRPYYVFHDTDVDRYTIDGQYRQTLLAPRELDITQVRNAGWINTRFIYTHGYGVAMAEVSKITPEGLPVYLIGNMPPQINTPSLKINRPQIYYGEVEQEPVFVRTAQQEFDFPSGEDNVKTRYDGAGGFSVSGLPMRLAAAIHFADPNTLLTNYLTPESRMMIHRRVVDRVSTLAGFLAWDPDPYLVITPQGRMVWMLDGYTTSDSHPFSRAIDLPDGDSVNYIRNAVKATVDAYDGATHLYVFAPEDPVIQAYQALFPHLFEAASAMPEELREHTRYPELLFRAQSEIYRAYHMLNPQAFYNREDLWDLARYTGGQEKAPEPVSPTYVVATLPGEEKPEFLLMTSFTPLTKENLIGVMLARCDGPHLGEIWVLQLSKQELTLGPMQVNARINQDQNISKDLTLWNQQGSQVLRGQMLVLPVEHTFLYVQPIYIEAVETKMPQLRKVLLAMGNRLIYTDTYEQALAAINGGQPEQASPAPATATTSSQLPVHEPPQADDAKLVRIRAHLTKYRDLAAQGKWADAGRELEAIQNEVK